MKQEVEIGRRDDAFFCIECQGNRTREGTATLTVVHEGKVAVYFDEMPALVCEQCGAKYPRVSSALLALQTAEDAATGWYLA